MEYIQVTKENIKQEHICCALSSNNDLQVSSKKAWLIERFEDGLVFVKSRERGKCFIEYIPAEYAWNPICAEGYMHINCLWVSGSLKGHGHATNLLNQCIVDSKKKGKKGLCIFSSSKKRPYLADPKFLKYKGFRVCDETPYGIQLWYYPFEEQAIVPKIKECGKCSQIEQQGYVLYYTNQCPFNAKYVPIIEELAKEYNIPFQVNHIQSKEDAQNAPTPITTYALFLDGTFVTNEVINKKRFLTLIREVKK